MSSPAGRGVRPGLDAADRFVPGAMLGRRFRIVSLLGRGGMGEVYRADDLELGQPVALKLLPARLTDDADALERLRGEVRHARLISHPNVCRVYDIGAIEGRFFLSMEFVDGEDLASVLRRLGRPSPEKAVQIAQQLCAGLAAVHDSGILHRDLKPSNIMIDGRGRVRLSDFGLSGAPRDGGHADVAAGTPAYMPPEQLSGREVTLRGDLYALGLVLFEVFTGRPAFEAATLGQLQQAREQGLSSGRLAMLAGVPPAVEAVVHRCLHPEPRQRPGSALEVAAALPGGDPLAAALAAGETPSPELVAAAGGQAGMRFGAAAACLAAALSGILLTAVLNRWTNLTGVAPPAKPPQVLVDRARDILRRLGHADESRDEAWGFWWDEGLRGQLGRDGRGGIDWSRLPQGRPALYRLWYRASPEPLVPNNTGGRIYAWDPPPLTAGQARVDVDDRGRLVRLEVLPPELSVPPAAAPPDCDWNALFQHAELNPGDFTPSPPAWNPLFYVDQRAAWEGHYPGNPDARVRVEAGAYAGRPVYLRLVAPGDGTTRTAAARRPSIAARMFELGGALLYLSALLGAAALARLNARLGRVDWTGARRVGLFAFGIMAAQLIGMDLRGGAYAWLWMVMQQLAQAVFQGVWMGLVYLAFEPWVRRLWPELLISWTRMLSGRWRDPQVGRAALLGALGAVVWELTAQLTWLAWDGAGLATPWPVAPHNSTLAAGRYAAAAFLTSTFLLECQLTLFLMVGFLFLFRRRWAAMVATWFVVGQLNAPFGWLHGGDAALCLSGLQSMLSIGIMTACLVRFGLLATTVMLFLVHRFASFPVTLDTHAWFFDTGLVVPLVAALTAIWGFRTAIQTRARAATVA